LAADGWTIGGTSAVVSVIEFDLTANLKMGDKASYHLDQRHASMMHTRAQQPWIIMGME
jgi:hypothetical protein